MALRGRVPASTMGWRDGSRVCARRVPRAQRARSSAAVRASRPRARARVCRLRAFNVYGDLHRWSIEDTSTKTVLSFMNVTKYPPSLDFLCVTLGLASLLLAVFERMRGALYDILQVFGRVPFFYYLLHLILISQTADLFIRLRDGAWPQP